MQGSNIFRMLTVAAGFSVLAIGGTSAQQVAESTAETSPAAEAMPTALTNSGWAEATLAKVVREGDKMTLQVRFKAADGAEPRDEIIYGTLSKSIWEQDIYVTAGDKKYLLLVDSNETPLASSNLALKKKGPQVGAWYGTFPAPPAGESATLQLPQIEPLGPFTVPE